tara:strand:+ start:50 stop:562 length:513 start_codon:yes stop_codon:yes gene_type:complete
MEVIMYTMPTCMFCKKLKDRLNEENITYIEKDYKTHELEWNKVKMLTGIPIFPTLKIDGRYYCPNRDFKSDEDAINLIKGIEVEPPVEVTLEVLYESLKTTRTQFENITQQFGIVLQEVRGLKAEIGNLSAVFGQQLNSSLTEQSKQRNELILNEQKIAREMKESIKTES